MKAFILTLILLFSSPAFGGGVDYVCDSANRELVCEVGETQDYLLVLGVLIGESLIVLQESLTFTHIKMMRFKFPNGLIFSIAPGTAAQCMLSSDTYGESLDCISEKLEVSKST